MRCVAFATLRPLQAQQHLISSQPEAPSRTLLLLAENYPPSDQVSGSTEPPGFGLGLAGKVLHLLQVAV